MTAGRKYRPTGEQIDEKLKDEIFEMIERHPSNRKGIIALRPPCPDAYVKFMGSNDGGIFLAQLIFWTPRATRADGFVYKSDKEWFNELHIRDHKLNNFRKFLVEQGVLKVKKAQANGHPTHHYRIDQPKLLSVFRAFLDNRYQFPGSNDHAPSIECETHTNPCISLDTLEPGRPLQWLVSYCRSLPEHIKPEERIAMHRLAELFKGKVYEEAWIREVAEACNRAGIMPTPSSILKFAGDRTRTTAIWR